jgi:uncharacterized membrane protein
MTTTEMTNFDQKNQRETPPETSTRSSIQKTLFTLKLFEYLLLAAFFSAGIVIIVYPDNQQAVVGGAISLTFAIFLFLLNKQAFQDSQKAVNQSELNTKAELYTYLLNNNNSSAKNSLTPARGKALQYSQDLIDEYKKTRDVSRNLYYVLQILTVVLSGVTPILVLVDKLEAGQAWLKWLPVICPALASIVASIVTSFPFQKNWVAANAAVELLEAEQEKFILGVTPPYRCYDVTDEIQQQQKVSQALEYFVVQVNNIHLQQVQQGNEPQPEKKESDKSPDSKSESTQQSSN